LLDHSHADVTVDYFDHNSTEFARHRYEWYGKIREEHGQVFWTPRNGGFWVVIGLEELTEAARDWGTFSSRCGVEQDGIRYEGLFAPPLLAPQRMIQEDPPGWNVPRRALSAMFSPPAVGRWRERIQVLVDACIDRRIEAGRMNLVVDLTRPVSSVLSLELAGLPADNFAELGELYSLPGRLSEDDPRWAEVAAGFEQEAVRIDAAIDHHESARGPGVITALLNARDGGADLTRADIHDLVRLLVAAGLDTTSALVSSTFLRLVERPSTRRALTEDPGLLDKAIDELIRHGTPTQGLLRTATKDTVLGGRQIRRGERVMFCYGAADRDPREFPDPDEIVIDRPTKRSVAFGSGIHKCLGMHFARLEFQIVVRTVLDRIPDFQVERSGVEAYDHVGIVAGWASIPVTFTPGGRVGADPGLPDWQ
jgi:cytochrome P450